MHSKLFYVLLCTSVTVLLVSLTKAEDEDFNQVDRQQPGRQGKFGFPTSLLTNLAQDLFTRSSTSSQVLSLNLTNLVILLVLKAIIFGASSLGFGHHGRSIESGTVTKDPLVTENEAILALSYLKGDIDQKYSCLHRIACENPTKAKEYLMAAGMVLKGASFFSKSAEESRYHQVLSDLKEAVNYGNVAQDCSIRYTCEREG